MTTPHTKRQSFPFIASAIGLDMHPATAAYTMDSRSNADGSIIYDGLIACTLTGPANITLPSAAITRIAVVVDCGGNVDRLPTLVPAGGQTINGGSSLAVTTPNGGYVLHSDGAINWIMIGKV